MLAEIDWAAWGLGSLFAIATIACLISISRARLMRTPCPMCGCRYGGLPEVESDTLICDGCGHKRLLNPSQ